MTEKRPRQKVRPLSKRLTRRRFLGATVGGAALSLTTRQRTALGGVASSQGTAARSDQRESTSPSSQSTLLATGDPPILILTDSSSSNPYGAYLGEILKAEGITSFETSNLSSLSTGLLAGRSVVVLAEGSPSSAQITLLDDFVASGGGLVAMRPASGLDSILGINRQSGTVDEGYIRITNQPVGGGLYDQTMQIHGSSSNYSLAGASSIADLYSSRTSSTGRPAASIANHGAGRAAMLSYDLARSVVLTRQGDPSNADVDVDGDGIIRSVDLYNGWVDLERSSVPQADIQQRLFIRLIEAVSPAAHPRIWYFPGTAPTVLVATGDAHANPNSYYQNMVDAFSQRGMGITFYLTTSGPSRGQVSNWMSQGFDFAPHPYVDGGYLSGYQISFDDFINDYGFAPRTARTHQVRWTGWNEAASTAASVGSQMDFNSYQWGTWLNTPSGPARGYINGSGLPMRFADANGAILPIYQQHTSLVDEELAPEVGVAGLTLSSALNISHQTIDESVNGYHTAIVTQYHVDYFAWGGVNAWVLGTTDYALQRGAQPLTADEWLSFVQARESTAISNVTSTLNVLSFDLTAGGSGQTMLLPLDHNGSALQEIRRGGSTVSYTSMSINGRLYATIPATSGTYEATYEADTTAPVISGLSAAPTDTTATITWTTDEPASSQVEYGEDTNLGSSASDSSLVESHSIEISDLDPQKTYYYQATSADSSSNAASSQVLTFETLPADAPILNSVTPSVTTEGSQQSVTLGGQNFQTGATAAIASTPLLSVQVLDSTTIQATVPGTVQVGTHPISVTNPDGQSATLVNAFQVLAAPPLLISVSPVIATANDVVTLTGDRFASGATVLIGSTPANNPVVVDSQQMTITVPLSIPEGLYGVTVTNPDGQSSTLASALTVSPLPSVGHTTASDFAPGTTAGTEVVSGGAARDGAVRLENAGFSDPFDGTSLDPTLWTSGNWQTDGSVQIANGILSVSGAWVRSVATLPFSAVTMNMTFGTTAWQNAGLSRSDNLDAPWFLFGVPGWDTSRVYARYNTGSSSGDIPLDGLIGDPHDYRIEYRAGLVSFLVDGQLVHEVAATIGDPPAIWLSVGSTGAPLAIDSVTLESFAPSGTFLSPALDAAETVTWQQLIVDANVPVGTALAIRARTSHDAQSWSPWSSSHSNFPIDITTLPAAQFLQYELDESTSDPLSSPMVESVSASYESSAGPTPNSVIVSPQTTTLEPGETEQFSAEAYDSNGLLIPGAVFDWSVVNGGGSIDASGLFTAGSILGDFTDTVVASTGGNSGTATVTVQAAPGPQITTISPSSATVGEMITMTGQNFDPGATVDIGAVPANAVTFLGDQTLTFDVPSLSVGTYDVTVTNEDSQSATSVGGLTVVPTITPIQVTQSTVADFSSGTLSDTEIANSVDGELLLVAGFIDDFDGSRLANRSWRTGSYGSPNTIDVNGNGQAIVTNGFIESKPNLSATAVTARLIFEPNGQPFINFGFGPRGSLDAPWFLFGNTTFNTEGIFARSNTGSFYQDTFIPSVGVGEEHEFTIQRFPNRVVYLVDGAEVATHFVAEPANTADLGIWFSAANASHTITADWIRVDEFPTSGTFTSDTIDAGATTSWQDVAGEVSLPPGTAVNVRLRSSDDGSNWSAWSGPVALAASPQSATVPAGRYVQYELELIGDSSATPVVESITLSGEQSSG